MNDMHRRHFLRRAAACSLGFAGLEAALRSSASAALLTRAATGAGIGAGVNGGLDLDGRAGFGPLVSDSKGILDLPERFSYRVVSRVGDIMDDGLFLPGEPDGMAAFPGPDGATIVVRNHETTPGTDEGPFGKDNERLARVDRDRVYDYGKGEKPHTGGTSTFVWDTRTVNADGTRGKLVQQSLSLAGTERNCAGGATPRNTWISCEETVTRAGGTNEKDHGYNFEVPATNRIELARPDPIIGMGRMNHEACCTDPATGIVYQTEDRHEGLIYRYVPNDRDNLLKGGKLQALVVRDRPSLDTRNWRGEGLPHTVERGVKMTCVWADIRNVESPEDDLRFQGFDTKGCARFARGEGMWFGVVARDGTGEPTPAVYFACTNGGPAKAGQIWRYVPGDARDPMDPKNGGTLELFIESPDRGVLENADNITIAPFGDIIVCEDGRNEQFLVGVTPAGGIYKLGRNAISDSEFAGAAFSPDGSTMFVNIQKQGLTLAITGPWQG
jgi:secreted PhoX family phosphatase